MTRIRRRRKEEHLNEVWPREDLGMVFRPRVFAEVDAEDTQRMPKRRYAVMTR